MILTVDIGNSNIVFGVFRDEALLFRRRLHTSTHQSVDEYEMLTRGMLFAFNGNLDDLKGAVLSSVVPELTGVFSELLEKLTGHAPLTVSHELNLGIRIATEFPAKVGQDRLANAVAAFHKYRCALIVIDCGTATTLDVITSDGEFEGGLICPGMLISAEALYAKAAQLFQVKLDPPGSLIGKNTSESMQSGIVHGYTCMIESLIVRIKQEMSSSLHQQNPIVVITGGLASKIAPMLTEVIHEEDLTLKGLSLIHKLNKAYNP